MGTYGICALKYHLEKNDTNVPPPSPLQGTEQNFPYVVIGNESFPLFTNVLIPYPKEQCIDRKERRIYNYR